MNRRNRLTCFVFLLLFLASITSGCLPDLPDDSTPVPTASPIPTATQLMPTAIATRPSYDPGQLVDYTAQTGDTLDALAARFNTSVPEIRAANPIIPDTATTMPPGMPMKIPIYYRPLWGSPYQIIPDSLFVNGPAQVGFDPVKFVDQQPGWLKNYTAFAGGQNRRGGEIIQYVANNYSVSPRLLLALAEYQAHVLTDPNMPDDSSPYLLGKQDYHSNGLYRQLAWAADTLNKGYYDWRGGQMLEINLINGQLERPDPWLNAASVALHYYFSLLYSDDAYDRAISGAGLAQTYKTLFGDPWENARPHIPGSLTQPFFRLPFEPGPNWAFTGGPHNGWGDEDSPLVALDFAPPSVKGGCTPSEVWTTAVADGVIVRTDVGVAVLDTDGDGDERTGWEVFYLHLETASLPPVGKHFKAGERIGKPSCEGGHATGTHVHIARKYNGEWMMADGVLAFNLEGWISHTGSAPYQGTLTRSGRTVTACTCSDAGSQLNSTGQVLAP